jgi:GGDEF domain-containing protein
MNETLPRMVSRDDDSAPALGVVILDVDHCKQVSDHHGHFAGDRVLAELDDSGAELDEAAAGAPTEDRQPGG